MRQFTRITLVVSSVVCCSSVATAGRIQWAAGDGGNDHEYEAVLVEGGIEFLEAVQLAEAMGGYLATARERERERERERGSNGGGERVYL